jgi:hypothetical protein
MNVAWLKPFINLASLFWPNAAKWFTLSQGERGGVRAADLPTSACTLDLLAFVMISTEHMNVSPESFRG